jgi:hypothetical protein
LKEVWFEGFILKKFGLKDSFKKDWFEGFILKKFGLKDSFKKDWFEGFMDMVFFCYLKH